MVGRKNEDVTPTFSRSSLARAVAHVCLVFLVLNLVIVLISAIPPHVVLAGALWGTAFGVPLLLFFGGVFFRHVRASPVLNSLRAKEADRRVARGQFYRVVASQVPPRLRPAAAAAGALLVVIAAATAVAGPEGEPGRGGGPTGYYLDDHGAHTAISAAQYHWDEALTQVGFAMGGVLLSALALLVFLAVPRQIRAWPSATALNSGPEAPMPTRS
jgi:hypothetical protein